MKYLCDKENNGWSLLSKSSLFKLKHMPKQKVLIVQLF